VPEDCNGNGTEDALDVHFGFDSARAEDLDGRAVAADLNGDQLADLAGPGVFVLFNRGDGSFGEPARYDVAHEEFALVAADFDGDGASDLASAGKEAAASSIILLRNLGDGTFAEPRRSPFGLFAGELAALLAVDLNGDGNTDLVVNSFGPFPTYPADLTILLNRGDGTFDEGSHLLVAASFLTAGDFDDNGRADLAMLPQESSRSLLVLWDPGNPRGAGSDLVSYPVGAEPGYLVAGDWNGDQRLDLALATFDIDLADQGTVILLFNTGAREFEQTGIPDLGDAASLTAADLDGNGQTDLLVPAYRHGSFWILKNYADEGFDATHFPVGPVVSRLEPVDLNGDGRTDLAAAGFGILSVFLGQEDGGFLHREDAYLTCGDVSQGSETVFTDLSADGRPDVLTLSGRATCVLLNLGDGSFPAAYRYGVGVGAEFMTAADLDGDGKPEVVTANRTAGDLSILWNDGSAKFQATRHAVGTEPSSMVVADLNGDGKSDLATANFGSRDVSVLINAGGGVLATAKTHAVGGPPLAFASADFDADGKSDLITANHLAGTVTVLLNRSADFSARDHVVGDHPLSLALADLDGDGTVDVATGNFNSGNVSVLWSDGSGGFGPAAGLETGARPVSLAALDLDGDGKSDLAAANFGSSDMSVFIQMGMRRFESLPRRSLATPPQLMLAGNLDWDSAPDLVSVNRDSGSIEVLFNQGDGSFGESWTHDAARDGWDSMVAADLDASGRLDLVGSVWYGGGVVVFLNLGDRSFRKRASTHEPSGSSRRGSVVTAADLDADGDLDMAYASDHELIIFKNQLSLPHSFDGNGNGVPDECEHVPFHRGDANRDGRNDVSDAIFALAFLFTGGEEPGCLEAADTNNDGAFNISDPISLFNHLFLGGEAPPAPGPAPSPCGPDPDGTGSNRSLGCAVYDAC
jgi:hypothetical protein